MEEDVSMTIQVAVVVVLTANIVSIVVGLCLTFFGVIYKVNDKFLNAADTYHRYSIESCAQSSTGDKVTGALLYRCCVENRDIVGGLSVIVPIKVYESDLEDASYSYENVVLTSDNSYWIGSSWESGLTVEDVMGTLVTEYPDSYFTIVYYVDGMGNYHMLAYQEFYQGLSRVEGSSKVTKESTFTRDHLGEYYFDYKGGGSS